MQNNQHYVWADFRIGSEGKMRLAASSPPGLAEVEVHPNWYVLTKIVEGTYRKACLDLGGLVHAVDDLREASRIRIAWRGIGIAGRVKAGNAIAVGHLHEAPARADVPGGSDIDCRRILRWYATDDMSMPAAKSLAEETAQTYAEGNCLTIVVNNRVYGAMSPWLEFQEGVDCNGRLRAGLRGKRSYSA